MLYTEPVLGVVKWWIIIILKLVYCIIYAKLKKEKLSLPILVDGSQELNIYVVPESKSI